MDIAVGISLLSCIEAEICIMSYLLPVLGRNLWLLTNPHVRQPLQQSNCVTRPRTYVYRRWNVVAIVFRSWDIRYVISTFGYWPPSLIFRHTKTSDSIATCLLVLSDFENIGIAVVISFLCGLQADILVLPVWRTPFRISYFRLGFTTILIVPFDCLTSKT